MQRAPQSSIRQQLRKASAGLQCQRGGGQHGRAAVRQPRCFAKQCGQPRLRPCNQRSLPPLIVAFKARQALKQGAFGVP